MTYEQLKDAAMQYLANAFKGSPSDHVNAVVMQSAVAIVCSPAAKP